MSTLQATRSAQRVLQSSFTFNLTDTMTTTAGVSQALKSTAGVYEIVNLPLGAVVCGGSVVVEAVSNDSSTATISVGDSVSATRYASAVSMKSAARTSLTLTGYHGVGNNIRMTLANATGDATSGTVTVYVQYTIDGRGEEVYPN